MISFSINRGTVNRILLLMVALALFSWPTLISARTELLTTVLYAFGIWICVTLAIAGLCARHGGMCIRGKGRT